MHGFVALLQVQPLSHFVEFDKTRLRQIDHKGPRDPPGRTPATAQPLLEPETPAWPFSGFFAVAHPNTSIVRNEDERLVHPVVAVGLDRAEHLATLPRFVLALRVVVRLLDPSRIGGTSSVRTVRFRGVVSVRVGDPCGPSSPAALGVIAIDRPSHLFFFIGRLNRCERND